MNKTHLKVLPGGLADSTPVSRKVFSSAYVTNTRLMGVLGMYIHFKLPDNKTISDFHQFFYFDAEEYGFETYRSVWGNDEKEIQEIESSIIGGLGGKKVSLTLEEAKYILHEYVSMCLNQGIPLPEGLEEYGFLLKKDAILSEPDQYILQCKQCVRLCSSHELINYFLMRCFGKDFSAARYLAVPDLEVNLFPEFQCAALLKNSIEKDVEEGSFINESLIEFDDEYHLVITSVAVKGMKVSKYERVSSFRVSGAEAAMMLARPEYINVYNVVDDMSSFGRAATSLTANAMITKYDTGTLYMIFHPNNKHVNKMEYRLNEDVMGLYFLSDSGQLICAAYDVEQVLQLEWDLARSSYGRQLSLSEKYQFKEPVLYEFIHSGFNTFEKFVDAITLYEE